MVDSINKQLEDTRNKDGYLKYGKMKRVLELVNSTLPLQMHISRYDLANHRKRAKIDTRVCSGNTFLKQNVVVEERGMIDRPKGGRPTGSTNEKKRLDEVALVAARNEIALIFGKEKKRAQKDHTRMKRGLLQEIIKDVKKNRNIPDEVEIPADLIRKRVLRNNILINHTNGKGNVSPLLQYEDTFVELMVQMSRISHSLTPTQSISLINESIKGTTIQQNLIEWKHKYGIEKNIEGKIGMGYWKKIKKEIPTRYVLVVVTSLSLIKPNGLPIITSNLCTRQLLMSW